MRKEGNRYLSPTRGEELNLDGGKNIYFHVNGNFFRPENV